MAKPKRASWFKMFLGDKPYFDGASDAAIAEAIRAAFHYFDTGEAIELGEAANMIFGKLKKSIDEAIEDTARASEKNRQNVLKRWNKDIPNNTSDTTGINGIDLLPVDTKDTEADTEADAETEAKAEKVIRDNVEMDKGSTLASGTHSIQAPEDCDFEEKRSEALKKFREQFGGE